MVHKARILFIQHKCYVFFHFSEIFFFISKILLLDLCQHNIFFVQNLYAFLDQNIELSIFILIFKENQAITVYQPTADEGEGITKIRFGTPDDQKDNF